MEGPLTLGNLGPGVIRVSTSRHAMSALTLYEFNVTAFLENCTTVGLPELNCIFLVTLGLKVIEMNFLCFHFSLISKT